MCLSGCLTAYRRSVLVELTPILESRNILGVPIKYGEDRFLTRQIVKAGYQTTMTMDAVCRTDAATTLSGYFAQQLRWRRSNIVDYFGGLSHVWRIHPVVAVHSYSLFLMFLAYPVLLGYSLVTGQFWPLMTLHLAAMAILGVVYRVMTRNLPAEQRVSAAAILPMALVMPVTYAILTPLALLTLDSRAWETRGHEASEEVEETAALPVPVVRVRRAHLGDTDALNPIGVSEPLQ
jgi:cellulose synthase/poly-beta-1,6-N-acetylglucosamine synthase-like glycosyltransferase